MVTVRLNAEESIEGVDEPYADMIDRMAEDDGGLSTARNNLAQFVHAQYLRNYDGEDLLPPPYTAMLDDVDDEDLVDQLEGRVHQAYRDWLEDQRAPDEDQED